MAGDDRGSSAIAIFEDFEQVVTRLFVEWFEALVVHNQALNVAQGSLQAGVAAITTRERMLGKKPVTRTSGSRRQDGTVIVSRHRAICPVYLGDRSWQALMIASLA
ncbi:hypothetical protein ACVINY_003296 [Sinorhizobium meliloti]